MVVHPEFQLQFAEVLYGQFFLLQHFVNAFGGKDFQLSPQFVIPFIPPVGYHQTHRFEGQGIHHGFHGNVARQIPVFLVPVALMEGMAEQAVEQHVQICPIHQHPVGQIPLDEVTGVEQYFLPVGPYVEGGQVHFITQRTEGNVQKPHG